MPPPPPPPPPPPGRNKALSSTLYDRDESPVPGGSVSSFPLVDGSTYSSSDDDEVVSGPGKQKIPQLSVSFMGLFSVPMSPTALENNGFLDIKGNGEPHDDLHNTVDQLRELLQTPEYGHVVEDLEKTGEVVDEAMLARWMDAHGSSKEQSVIQMMAEHAVWRTRFVGEGCGGVLEESIEEILDAKIIFLQGNDVGGHPVLIFLAKRYDAQVFSKKLSRCLVYAMDGALTCADGRKNPKKQITWIFDLDSVNRKNISVEFLESMFAIFQGHYPECLHKLYFLNAPFLFWAIWRCASAFVAPGTREKIEFVSVHGAYNSPTLVSKVGNSILPDVYGGTSRWRPIEESVAILRDGGVLSNTPPRTRSQKTSGPLWYNSSPVSIPEFSFRSIIFWVLFIVGAIGWIVLKMLAL